MKIYFIKIFFILFLFYKITLNKELKNPERKLNILITAPAIAYSHVAFQLQLAEILAQRGHNITFGIHEIRPIPRITSKYVEIIKIHTSVANFEEVKQKSIFSHLLKNVTGFGSSELKSFGKSSAKSCREVLENEYYMNILLSKKFDLALAEEYDICSLPLFKNLKIDSIIMTTPMILSDLVEYALGIPIPRSYNTYNFYGVINAPELTFYQRLKNVYREFLNNFYGGYYIYEEVQKMLDHEYGKNYYNIIELYKQVNLFITNAHDLIDFTRPKTSKIINIGNIAVKKPNKLNNDIEKIFKKAEKGVILFSWGSQADLSILPDYLKLNLFNAFSKFDDYEFLIRYNKNQSINDDIIDNYPNIHPFKWLDQTSILSNNKTMAFITHGGRNSMSESLTYGVPTICIPLFADQQYNAALYRHKNIGIAINLEDLTEENVYNGLTKILFDSIIKKNAQTLKMKIDDYPYDSTEQFIKWVEYVAKFKEFKEFNLYGADMDIITHNNVDVYAFLIVIFLVFFLFTKILLQKLFFIDHQFINYKHKVN